MLSIELKNLLTLVQVSGLQMQNRACRNPSLGSRPWQRELQGCEPKGSPGVKPKGSPGVKPKGSPGAKARRSPGVKPRGSPGVTSHTPESARKC
jgi:hypothetical protein